MNRKQCFVLAWSCMIIGMMFIGLDTINSQCIDTVLELIGTSPPNSYTASTTYCIVNAEIYEPFIYLFFALNIVFMICGFLEPKEIK